MGRWEPNARGRLEQAAMELYEEHGFEKTTVAEIAQRAGLTERTFFRHYADKREVLFAGGSVLQEIMVRTVAEAPASAAPLAATAAALESAATVIPDRDRARRRQRIIDANPELQERELIKLDSLSAALTAALRERGVPDLVASLAAETGVAVFKVAFVRWLQQNGDTGLPETIRESMSALRAVTAPVGE